MNQLINPKSYLFKTILLVTLGLWVWNLYNISDVDSKALLISHYAISILGIGLIIFAFIPWYGFKYKGLGINGHYEKILLPTTYLLLIYNLLSIYGLSVFTLNIILALLFFFLIGINFILLYYHFKDPGKTPPSYFASNLYLKTETNKAENKAENKTNQQE